MNRNFQRVIKTLAEGSEVGYGFLGISPGTSASDALDDLRPEIRQATAVTVNRVSAHSPAAKAGIQPGDLILKVNQQVTRNEDELVREIGLLGPGTEATLLVYRKNRGGLQTLSTILGKWPVTDEARLFAANRHKFSWRGISFDYPTARRRFLPNRYLTEFPTGLLVLGVESASPASLAGLQVGQFIVKVGGESVDDPKQFLTHASLLSGPVEIELSSGDSVTITETIPIEKVPTGVD